MSREIVTQRQGALEGQELQALRSKVAEHFSIRPKVSYKTVYKRDKYGAVIGQDVVTVDEGLQIFEKKQPSAVLVAQMAMKAHPMSIGKHFTRLSHHKRFTHGSAAFDQVLYDLMEFLKDVSEMAIVQAVDEYILDNSSPYFPDTATLVARIRTFDDQIKWALDASKRKVVGEDTKKASEAIQRAPQAKKTTKQKRRVSRLIKISAKTVKTRWEKLFIELYPKHAKGV